MQYFLSSFYKNVLDITARACFASRSIMIQAGKVKLVKICINST
jgi:hypothetical protein